MNRDLRDSWLVRHSEARVVMATVAAPIADKTGAGDGARATVARQQFSLSAGPPLEMFNEPTRRAG
jgi:sugar/nucleoside kinase (ribokinase family)